MEIKGSQWPKSPMAKFSSRGQVKWLTQSKPRRRVSRATDWETWASNQEYSWVAIRSGSVHLELFVTYKNRNLTSCCSMCLCLMESVAYWEQRTLLVRYLSQLKPGRQKDELWTMPTYVQLHDHRHTASWLLLCTLPHVAVAGHRTDCGSISLSSSMTQFPRSFECTFCRLAVSACGEAAIPAGHQGDTKCRAETEPSKRNFS